MDAITFLKKEHSRFRKELTAISNLSEIAERKNRFEVFCEDLLTHEDMEKKVWYPRLKKFPELQDIIEHLRSEEKSTAEAIKKFQNVRFDFMWTLRFYKFKHDVNHHAKEEESELFPKVKELLDETEIKAIGEKMQTFRNGSVE